MCGRYALHDTPETLAEVFGLVATVSFAPRYNVAPSTDVPIIRAQARPLPEGGFALDRNLLLAHWGLVPFWAKDGEGGRYSMINARAEGIERKPAFRNAFRRSRCLIPASGFYEWQQVDGGKQPWYVSRRDGAPLAFAGLAEHREGPDGELESCAIVTTEANALMRPIHDRMPVVLDASGWDVWLDPHRREPATLAPLLVPCPSEWLQAWPVGRAVGNPRNQGSALIRALADGSGA